MRLRTVTPVLALLVLGPAVLFYPSVAHPCGNSRRMVDPQVMLVARASALLEAGKAKEARASLPSPVRDPALARRARLIDAVAAVRLKDDVRGALKTLRSLQTRRHDPMLEARVAEALAELPDGQAQALVLLRKLLARDLMPDAHAFATLARLLDRARDIEGRDQAVMRCRTATRTLTNCPDFTAPIKAPAPATTVTPATASRS